MSKRTHEIESWALNVIDRVLAKQSIEDDRVEAKAIWPDDTKKTARQLAGQANAARGEPILWLIGVEEKRARSQGWILANWQAGTKKSMGPTADHSALSNRLRRVVPECSAILDETGRLDPRDFLPDFRHEFVLARLDMESWVQQFTAARANFFVNEFNQEAQSRAIIRENGDIQESFV
jgi:hypothetical protein